MANPASQLPDARHRARKSWFGWPTDAEDGGAARGAGSTRPIRPTQKKLRATQCSSTRFESVPFIPTGAVHHPDGLPIEHLGAHDLPPIDLPLERREEVAARARARVCSARLRTSEACCSRRIVGHRRWSRSSSSRCSTSRPATRLRSSPATSPPTTTSSASATSSGLDQPFLIRFGDWVWRPCCTAISASRSSPTCR
mgnify:CR=1 FL=1